MIIHHLCPLYRQLATHTKPLTAAGTARLIAAQVERGSQQQGQVRGEALRIELMSD